MQCRHFPLAPRLAACIFLPSKLRVALRVQLWKKRVFKVLLLSWWKESLTNGAVRSLKDDGDGIWILALIRISTLSQSWGVWVVMSGQKAIEDIWSPGVKSASKRASIFKQGSPQPWEGVKTRIKLCNMSQSILPTSTFRGGYKWLKILQHISKSFANLDRKVETSAMDLETIG